MDLASLWDPWPGSLEPWVSSDAGVELADRIEGLAVVTEASGPFDARLLSDHVAVRTYQSWSSRRPRTRAVQMWTRGSEGHAQALAVSHGL